MIRERNYAMEKKVIKRILAMSAAVLMAVSLILPAFSYAKTNETDKGTFHIDWNKAEIVEAGKSIPVYGVLKDANGYYIYAVSSTEIDTFNFFVKYTDGTYNAIIFKNSESKLFNINNTEIKGGKYAVRIKDDVRYAELFVPYSFFESDDFILATQDYGYVIYEDVTGEAKAITYSFNIKDATDYIAMSTYSPKKPENYEIVTASKPEPDYTDLGDTYNGIEIDGDFNDWNAVTKYRLDNSIMDFLVNGNDATIISAIVWDGDTAYIYIRIYGSFISKGSIQKLGISQRNNTKYYVRTDTGEELTFSITKTGSKAYYGTNVTVNGAGGAEIAADYDDWFFGGDYQYEISVPLKNLTKNASTIVFGSDITGDLTLPVGNIGKVEDDPTNDESDIVIDGDISDWGNLPYQYIYYCDAKLNNGDYCGTDNPYTYPYYEYFDYNHKGYSTASVYLNGDKLYGHINSRTDRSSTRLFYEIKVRINDSQTISLYSEYHYNTNYNVQGACSGTFDLKDASGNVVGRLYCRDERRTSYYGNGVRYNMDEEFYIDMAALASSLGLGTNELKSIELQFPYIGYQWVKVAGTSTAPFIGILICISIVGATWFIRFMKNKKASAI